MTNIIPISLHSLRSHSIFIPPPQSLSEEWELVDSPEGETSLVGQRKSRSAMRDKDLLVVFGKELRMTSLGSGDGWEVRNGVVGNYKTLKSPHLTFEIHQIVLNPTGRLLAVVGHHQLVILVLPKTGFASSINSDVNCRSFPVDEFQHSPSSTNAIAKVSWHPWGEGGNSLWALMADGKLFEYDILHPQDPVQTFNFLPELAAPSTSRFSAADPLSQIATSFAFSRGETSFGPLMVYVLIANGDIYTMGPVLPLHAEVPTTYLSALKAYTDLRLRRLKADQEDVKDGSAEHASQLGRVGLQSQWVDSLLRQVNTAEERRARQEEEGDRMATPSKRGYGLLDQSTRSRKDSDASVRPSLSGNGRVDDGLIRLYPPHLTESGGPAPGVHRSLLRQGPVVFSPAPEDVDEEEQVASDIYIFEAKTDEEGDDREKEGTVLIGIAWSGGRVDIAIEAESPEPRWISSRDPSPSIPVLPIVESILLERPLDLAEEVIDCPIFVNDPLHTDTFYVQSSSSVDSISVAPWINRLDEGQGKDFPASKVSCLVESAGSSHQPIIGVTSFCNIALGYGILALSTLGQLAAIELDLRMDTASDDQHATLDIKVEPTSSPHSDDQSLLGKSQISFDKLLSTVRQPLNVRLPLSKLTTASKPIETISAEHLRAVGEASLLVQKRLEAIRSASITIEERLDLQIKEYARQMIILKECQAGIEKLKTNSPITRAKGMMRKQSVLGERLDKVLSALSAEYRPGVGEVERKWFDELERLKSRVQGGGPVKKGKSLASRSQILKEQLSVVKPMMESKKQDLESNESEGDYGSRQLKPLEEALSVRSNEISRMMRKMDMLSSRLESVSVHEDGEESD